MATSKEQICNLSVSLFGSEALTISDFDNDTGKFARQCRLHYQPTLDELLRMHTWNCSKKRAKLIGTVPSITESNQGPFTDDGTTVDGKAQFANLGDTYRIRWSTSNDRWEYGTWSTPTFTMTFYSEVDSLVPPETGWTDGATSTISLTLNYAHGWRKAYRLPSDCIRPLHLSRGSDSYERYDTNQPEWSPEGSSILTNQSAPYLLYIGEPSISVMDSLFVKSLYTLLAIKLIKPMDGDDQTKAYLINEFSNDIMPEARRVNAFEGSETPKVDSEWLDATNNSSTGGGFMYPEFSSTDFGSFSW